MNFIFKTLKVEFEIFFNLPISDCEVVKHLITNVFIYKKEAEKTIFSRSG